MQIEGIAADFEQFTFTRGPQHSWRPLENVIIYNPERLAMLDGQVGLLHEIGHGLLGHRYYEFDIELLQMECEAWECARELAARYNLEVTPEHVEHCLESYNTWLEERASCPDCEQFGVQLQRNEFRCFACGMGWQTNDRKTARVRRTRLAPQVLIPDFLTVR